MTRPPLITPDELSAKLGTPDLRIVDASWHLPAAGRNAAAEFAERHLPGAVFFDLDAHVTPGPLPHMLPTPATFAAAAGALGIACDDDIVVYDAHGLFSAPRVRWMFRHFGATRVTVLDGGLPAWLAAGHPVESGEPAIVATRFAAAEAVTGPATDPATAPATDATATTPAADDGPRRAVASAEDVLGASSDGRATVLDARSRSRFTAEEPEARPGLRSGHVPGSVSLPFTELVEGGRLKPDEALREVFAARNVALDRPIVTTCGSGVTAAVISLALERLGARDVALYDGSWAEWGGRADLPVETG